ncbi:MAG TPA: c-type cytochrome [Gemmatimonadaceae bacterium]|jgi:cytochrome c oxidase cbb3-type subunit 3
MSSRFERGAWRVRRDATRTTRHALLLLTLTACERENRRFSENPPTAAPTASALVVSQLQPGPAVVEPKIEAPYDDNAWAVSEGKALFNAMNCSGCHFQGGGGIGPALMDEEWIYGSDPQQIFASIAEGRPNGMPAWKYKLGTQQIWELVSYVRSLSSLNPKGARGGRDDHMMVKPPEASTPQTKPKMASTPPGDD